MSRSKALDQTAKWKLRRDGTHYDLYVDGHFVMCLMDYSEIVSKAPPKTYEQVLIGEVLGVLYDEPESHTESFSLGTLYRGAYYDLKSTFERSREAGEAKALALAKKLYLDDFNRAIQASTWVKNGHSSGVLEMKLLEHEWDRQYLLRFSDGVDSITIKSRHAIFEWFVSFWYFRTWRIKPLISALLNECERVDVTSSLRGVGKEHLLRALELALRYGTTLGAALFLTARD